MICVHTCQTLVGAPQDVVGWWERREDQQQRGLFLFVCVEGQSRACVVGTHKWLGRACQAVLRLYLSCIYVGNMILIRAFVQGRQYKDAMTPSPFEQSKTRIEKSKINRSTPASDWPHSRREDHVRVLLLFSKPVTRTLAKFGEVTTSGAKARAMSRRKKKRRTTSKELKRIQRLFELTCFWRGGEILHTHTHASL